MPRAWYELDNAADVPSPALLVYPERAAENIRRLVTLAGDPSRLRPHLKTTKLAAIVRALAAEGIHRVKVATLAEAAMAAGAGARDVLLAYQPVGPNVARLLDLQARFPETTFSALVDDETAAAALSAAASARGATVRVLLDLDVGMHRTGIPSGPAAVALYEQVARLPSLRPGGLHAYDGHLRDRDPAARAAKCDAAYEPVDQLRDELCRRGLPVPVVVAGGSPTFPRHARRPGVECSPGTLVFSDLCTQQNFPDLDFLPAALVLSRVVSHPGGRRLCLDLGHKAVASENPHPRVSLLNLPDAQAGGHSEEHLVVETPHAADVPVGTVVYGLPWHICPTVALYDEAIVARGGRAAERWPIARGRGVAV
jgi:D-serine deaminase-like pyridoxal phosphate-dependent protein